MSYYTEHQRMRPVLEKARRLDIASHPAPKALFEALPTGFNIWCTPNDHPTGWEGIKMEAGAFSKPCEYVGTALWGWAGEQITHIELETEAYALRDRDRGHYRGYHNRLDDVLWAAAKVAWLFSLAGVACPPLKIADDDDQESWPEIAEAKPKAETDLACPHCSSRLRATPVYFQSERRLLLTCENSGSCNFREL